MKFPIARIFVAAMILLAGGSAIAQQPDPFGAPYAELCAVCHGPNLEGAAQGTPLARVPLKYGDSIDQLATSIAKGLPQAGMAGWSATLSDSGIRRLALFISER